MTGPFRRIDTALLLRAYAAGLFPMADRRDSPDVFWVEPRRRGIIPLEAFHLPRSLARTLKRETFRHTVDRAFAEVIAACADPAPGREQSWINRSIEDAYNRLHQEGHAHSVETWDANGELVGGLYGVRIGAAFFGESMFSRRTDASKAALAHLVARLRAGGFRLLDTQFWTPHLGRFGAIEVKRSRYLALLEEALATPACWTAFDTRRPAGPDTTAISGKAIVQFLTQTS
ncbi:MAG: leucyl/phenylalanyl-tRNA--protein transferase [Sphingomonadaceae bacterium]|uniref:leucyl/phenylalanyl-tRNA--protein transferase n=1 Tax=Thermaurantiacus sp. TaxID=2820283 RepID=UPI00298F34CC|nr:leucyl/phenylalanyl-tRNA--protein transferase [Thermaurantiacus sp.]MCS6986154.1 leucyl/phenylalanyl-tRNA--protein transferase [Sphingomonadaceae bacterium]MDW8414620.1 leucyl/phenylalanyl-tRNA--protein transferase [Thermaurantiacus sp.]